MAVPDPDPGEGGKMWQKHAFEGGGGKKQARFQPGKIFYMSASCGLADQHIN